MESRKPSTTTQISFTSHYMSTRTAGSTPRAPKETGTTVARVLGLESECCGREEILRERSNNVDNRNINIPWPDQGMGDGDYMYAFQEVVMPIATEFDPDLVISKICLSKLWHRC